MPRSPPQRSTRGRSADRDAAERLDARRSVACGRSADEGALLARAASEPSRCSLDHELAKRGAAQFFARARSRRGTEGSEAGGTPCGCTGATGPGGRGTLGAEARSSPRGITRQEETVMDHDRSEGSAKTMLGRLKGFFGRITGDTKLQTEGKMDQAEGKIQNTFGGVKDSLREGDKR
jgi:uncharacterized protein YjbJ (UPF0337 family)